jgi:hypothetical protein
MITAPCLDGGLCAFNNQTGLTDAVISLVYGLMAALGAVAEIRVGLNDLDSAALVKERTETDIRQLL